MAEIDSLPHIDEALSAVYTAMRTNPYAFGVAPPITTIRYAKTQFYVRDQLFVPSITILFTINEADKLVKIIDAWANPSLDDFDP
jgi:hypothetical protein